MDGFGIFHLLAKFVSSVKDSDRETKAYYASKAELQRKYNLPEPTYNRQHGRTRLARYGDSWLTKFDNIIDGLTKKTQIDNECYELCNDIVMFCYTLSDHVWIDRWDENEKYRPVFRRIGDFRKTDTFVSLVEMSRGRGSDYALRLINKELPGKIRPLNS